MLCFLMRAPRVAFAVAASLMFGAALLGGVARADDANFVSAVTIAGNATDLAPGSGANQNRLGGFGSDIYYDRYHDVYYGVVDRGPGGGVISYETRVQKFTVNVDKTTGAISNFKLLDTIKFTDKNGNAFNGLNPTLLNGNSAVLGNSFDPEGFVVSPNGTFYVSDEYGPSISEFGKDGKLIRTFATPDNLISKAGTTPDFTDGRPIITTGRQDNRGFEGVSMSPDGKKLYAVLQDPLVNEGSSNDGRRSQNLRIVEFDTATGLSGRQFIYQLESLSSINSRIPGTANDFGATAQGRNIGLSSIIALNDNEFLVLERDNRGVGVTDVTGAVPVASKRVYQINLSSATDVSGISLAGTNTLPGSVTPVSKTLFLDLQTALTSAGQIIPEKIEGITIGKKLNDGTYSLIIGTDNDFSVTQNGNNEQFDVYSDGTQVPIDSPGLDGRDAATLLPLRLQDGHKTPELRCRRSRPRTRNAPLGQPRPNRPRPP